MPLPLIPIVIGLGTLGVVAFAAGGKKAPAKPATHRPKKRPPTVAPATEAAIIAAMSNPAAMKAIIDRTAATGDPVALWNLGRTILVNSKNNPRMQSVASAVLAQAVVLAAKRGKLAELVSNALVNGDAGILAAAAKSAAAMSPELAAQLNNLASQLGRSGQSPARPPTKTPTKSPATASDDARAKQAAAAATQVIVDAIKQTGVVQSQPAQAPLPSPSTPSNVTVLPEVIITPGEGFAAQVDSPEVQTAIKITDYLRTTSRYKEDKGRVGAAQKKLGLSSDGNYGPGSASLIATLGVVPVPPFYWTKGKAPKQKADYKLVIAEMRDRFPNLNWDSALKGVDAS